MNIWTLSGYFTFFISFFCWNEISKKFSIKEDTRKMENCKTNHILDRSSWRCSVKKDRKIHRKTLCHDFFISGIRNLTRSFILQDLFYTLGTPSFRTTRECYSILFFLTAMCQEFTLFCFFENKTPCTFFQQLITFNSNWWIRQQKQLRKLS